MGSPMTSRTLSLTGAHVTVSLLDTLVDAVETTGETAASDALIRRFGERIARSLVEHGDNIEALAEQLLPVSRLLAAADDEISISLTSSDPSEASVSLMLEPPTPVPGWWPLRSGVWRQKGLRHPAATRSQAGGWRDLRVQTIRLRASGEAGLNAARGAFTFPVRVIHHQGISR